MAENSLGKGYEAGFITGKYYDFSNEIPKDILINDYVRLIKLYKDITILIKRHNSFEEYYNYIDNNRVLEEDRLYDNKFNDEYEPTLKKI
jgi:hypothetical protein